MVVIQNEDATGHEADSREQGKAYIDAQVTRVRPNKGEVADDWGGRGLRR